MTHKQAKQVWENSERVNVYCAILKETGLDEEEKTERKYMLGKDYCDAWSNAEYQLALLEYGSHIVTSEDCFSEGDSYSDENPANKKSIKISKAFEGNGETPSHDISYEIRRINQDFYLFFDLSDINPQFDDNLPTGAAWGNSRVQAENFCRERIKNRNIAFSDLDTSLNEILEEMALDRVLQQAAEDLNMTYHICLHHFPPLNHDLSKDQASCFE